MGPFEFNKKWSRQFIHIYMNSFLDKWSNPNSSCLKHPLVPWQERHGITACGHNQWLNTDSSVIARSNVQRTECHLREVETMVDGHWEALTNMVGPCIVVDLKINESSQKRTITSDFPGLKDIFHPFLFLLNCSRVASKFAGLTITL